jgi:hypothetical protein
MKPIEFYHWAAQKAQEPLSEAEIRTVVSRLYYGLHHEACCRYFRVNPNATPLARTRRHADLRERFNTGADLTHKKIGNLLNDMISLRVRADYELGQINFRNMALSPDGFLKISQIYAIDLLQALQEFSPGEAEDGCACPSR